MKKIVTLFSILLTLTIIYCKSNTITIKRINLMESNNNEKVDERTLALASALSYMPIPASCKINIKNNKNCYFSNRSIVVDQFNQYINLHNYATTKELDGWQIVDYTEKKSTIANLSAIFNAYTLKKDNNVILVMRGTDFTDLLEWIQHLSYARDDIHAQESLAEEYVLKQAKKYKDYNIYITGHSLGGYLTQIGAAALQKAINNGNNNETDWTGFNLSKKKYDLKKYLSQDTLDFSEYKDINFVQAVSFNGMGLLFNYNDDQIKVQDEKIKILLNLGNNIYNEPKIINYCVKGDIVSSLGIHFGETRVIKASLDSVSYHKKNYKFLSILRAADATESLLTMQKESVLINSLIKNTLKNSDYTFTNLQDFYNDHIKEDLISDYKYYGMNSIIGYLNLTHEVDEFACILNSNDNASVKIVEETPWLLSTQANYLKSLNRDVQMNDIIKNSNINTTLRAMTYNACARKYEWYECNSNSKENCKLIKTNTLDGDNKDNTINVKVSNSKKYYYVKSYYNDNYESTQTVANSDGTYSVINNGSIRKTERTIDSDMIMIISDKERPKCKFDAEYVNVSLKKRLLSYKSSTDKITLTCTDNLSGFNKNLKVYRTYFSRKDAGLIPSISIDDVKLISNSGNKIVVDVNVTSTRVPLFLTPKLIYQGYIKDISGNASSKSSVEFNIMKK